MAIWAMIIGIVSMIPCCMPLSPVAIVLGIVAQSQIKKNPQQGGSGFAIVGIVLGIISLLMLIIRIIVVVANPDALKFGSMG